ncbi:putative GMC oxidoreductase [Podospora fimiseda]|uniref:GMC oxidoreductase n=1 Tax=Podospora fimiseda TaxID=252190 RepID=A0AAN7H3I5_9PEZI|nr:putative GMC oxidoreductase [Podospora fimiseda]
MDFAAFFRALLLCALLPVATHCLHIPPQDIIKLLPSYDYIIVGGGVAGLVIANRLSNRPDVTVLVLEAGGLDSSPDIITVPGLIGHGFIPSYNWNFSTAPQEFLDNNTRYYDQGHVVGGGSILNGLIMTRGAKADYNAWEALGNPNWNWHHMIHYFKKSERFSPPDLCSDQADTLHIHPQKAYHGTKGHLKVGYSNFFYNQSANFLQGLSELGIPILDDPNIGISAGASIAPASMNTKKQSREDSRRAYLDHVLNRPNLHLASEQTVTRILMGPAVTSPNFNNSNPLKMAYGVEFATSASSPRTKITCNKEVILSAGAIVSPALLQVSGIGPAAILKDLNVSIQIDLPGVGANFQDHPMVHAFYNYTAPGLFSTKNLTGATLQQVEQEYFTNRTGPWTHPLISTIAFPHLSHLLSSSSFPNLLSSNLSFSLPPHLAPYPTLQKGYLAQLKLLQSLLANPTVGAVEVMADSIGTLTVSVQHPLSRGFVRALSPDLLLNNSLNQTIHIDPRYCSHPLDCDLLLHGLKLNSRLISTSPMQNLQPRPPFPWNMTDDETILSEAIRSQIVTEFHPSGTTSMLPLEYGGVVNPRLMVYGTTNLRVVDAGVIPLLPSAHLQAAVYAIAERAADIIKKDERLKNGEEEQEGPSHHPVPGGEGNGIPIGPGVVTGPQRNNHH